MSTSLMSSNRSAFAAKRAAKRLKTRPQVSKTAAGVLYWLACASLLFAMVALSSLCFASEGSASQSLFAAHLGAGEFGPARQIALAAADIDQRDRLLSRIALGQAVAGSTRASLSTISQIADDRVRGSSLDQVRYEPIHPQNGFGGGPQADFDALIDLITTTIDPDSWEEVGGAGAIQEFESGVRVDASGLMKKIKFASGGASLASLHEKSLLSKGNQNVRLASQVRKVSLTRLEKQVQMLWAMGKRPDAAMKNLAGLQKIQYVFVYPESGDIVLAGPAGDWRTSFEGRTLGADNNSPVLQLDDLIVVLRNSKTKQGRFGCSINPTKDGLAEIQKFVDKSNKKPIRPSGRRRWLEELRSSLGQQEIVVYGIDPRTRAAQVLVEADYRMKLVGMGLDDPSAKVTSYLDAAAASFDGKPRSTDVLRWWFTLNYQSIQAAKSHTAFSLQGQGVKVLSENELLTAQGDRIHTGKSDVLNQAFTQSFTKHFNELAEKYPVYAELRNIFDLALVSALLQAEDIPGQVDWRMTHFGDGEKYQVALGVAPQKVDTVVNHRVIRGKHILAFVSGGVRVNPRQLVSSKAIKADRYGRLKAEHTGSVPKNLPSDSWWWD